MFFENRFLFSKSLFLCGQNNSVIFVLECEHFDGHSYSVLIDNTLIINVLCGFNEWLDDRLYRPLCYDHDTIFVFTFNA
jgi:hypothetical protein